jgi:hypothetical protein
LTAALFNGSISAVSLTFNLTTLHAYFFKQQPNRQATLYTKQPKQNISINKMHSPLVVIMAVAAVALLLAPFTANATLLRSSSDEVIDMINNVDAKFDFFKDKDEDEECGTIVLYYESTEATFNGPQNSEPYLLFSAPMRGDTTSTVVVAQLRSSCFETPAIVAPAPQPVAYVCDSVIAFGTATATTFPDQITMQTNNLGYDITGAGQPSGAGVITGGLGDYKCATGTVVVVTTGTGAGFFPYDRATYTLDWCLNAVCDD